MNLPQPDRTRNQARRLSRVALGGALCLGLLVPNLWPEGASAQTTDSSAQCNELLNSCNTLLHSAQQKRSEQAATILDLQNQIAQLKEGHGFHGLSDYQALNIASSALERLEEPAPPDASTEELLDKTARLKAIQQRTSKLRDKFSARAAQQKAAADSR